MMESVWRVSPMPWYKDELNNIYDATGRKIFRPCAHDEMGPGVMVENDGNAMFVIVASMEVAKHERRENETSPPPVAPSNIQPDRP